MKTISLKGSLFALPLLLALIAGTVLPGVLFAKEKDEREAKKEAKSALRARIRTHVEARIGARLIEHPVVLDDWEDLEDFFDDSFWRKCFPWGHFRAPGWLRKHHDELDSFWRRCGSATTTPDATAPIISNFKVARVGTTSATVTWSTDEKSSSRAFVGTTTPLTRKNTKKFEGRGKVTEHSVILKQLRPGATYFVFGLSRDRWGNAATSTTLSFTTLGTTTPPVADTTSPTISGQAVTGIASTSATVSWSTNELATGKIYYATSTPVVTASAAVVGTTTLSLAHTFLLSALSASSTYHLLLESKDGSGNAATSTLSFTTSL